MQICLPIMAKDVRECIDLIQCDKQIKLVEIRIDAFDRPILLEHIKTFIAKIREQGEKSIITFRTHKEGGLMHLDNAKYDDLIYRIIKEADPEYIDIQRRACSSDSRVCMLTSMAKNKGIKVILSYHDIMSTDSVEKIKKHLLHLKYLGADVPKIAMKANSDQDVLNMLRAVKDLRENIGDMIAISTGELGKKTRLEASKCGQIVFAKAIGSKSSDELGQLSIEEYLEYQHG